MRTLQDSHGRKVRKLRLSLTDKCNLRCHYCMPIDSTFISESKFLSPDQYAEIVSELCELGLEEVRLTGGEPLMRKSFKEIAKLLSSLPLKKISLTTNGILLDSHLADLKAIGINHLNISLDSLNEATFQKITFGNHLQRVMLNIDAAQALGFKVKINVVAMRGVNDHEFFDFVNYSSRTGIEVRFLELMRIGYALEKQLEQFISGNEILENLKTRFEFSKVVSQLDSTSVNYSLNNGAKIGFIASESQAFCGQCSRWRLSADGVMRACLLKDDGILLKDLTKDEREKAYYSLLDLKPLMRPREVAHQMNAIGG